MFARVYSMGIRGMEAFPVEVETNISTGLPCIDIIGLPDAAVKESRVRVQSVAMNCGLRFPKGRITVNLAPADIRKEGAIYDLPILLSILAAGGQISADLSRSVFVGELSLSGELRPARGVLPMILSAKENNFTDVYIPFPNSDEGEIPRNGLFYPVKSILQLIDHLSGKERIPPCRPIEYMPVKGSTLLDFADVRGQESAKRGLEIAAAGGHNLLMIGPPGSGKSMLAKRLPSILPDMTFEEMLETTKLYSVAGELSRESGLIRTRPFRSPHHSISAAGLAGGGTLPRPGELSLAHNGVLFLDELPEFSRNAMEILRQPLEDGTVTISRASGSTTFPCSLMLVAAMNPCPCGFYGHPSKPCRCSETMVNSYLGRISGPLLDRIDLHLEIPPVDFAQLNSSRTGETSAQIRDRVNAAREIQNVRFRDLPVSCNARIPAGHLQEFCRLTESAESLLKNAFHRLGMSARAYDRILKVSRTIADLAHSRDIESEHIAEALQYRTLDQKYWRG